MALGMDPSAICLQWPAPENALGSAMCRMRPIRKSRSFLPNYRKLQEMLKEICAINAELVRRRESLG
jgi:hypothetical protein